MADPLPLPPMSETGISAEDQADIVAQIDRVAQENRLQATPQMFQFHPRKKGFVVPLAVNLGGLAVLLLGLGTLWLLFRQGAETLVQNKVVLQSTEGRLLEELKKASETELLAKDQQIADIQKQMATLAQQKSALQATMQEKIAAREVELQQQLKAAIEAERSRLAAAGFSQAVIEERLKTFEKQKTAEFQQQLDEYKKRAETERSDLESNLKKQQESFQKNLSDLAKDRQALLEDSKRKQNQLQAQLDEKSRDLEAQKSANQAQLAQAQQLLSDLNEQRTRTESVENQLLGLYTKVAQTIQSRQFPEALKQVQGLVAFLNDASVRALPDIQKRRDADLLLAATLSDWLTQDQKRLDADAARVLTTQSSLDTVAALNQQAQQATAAGQAEEAQAIYAKALAEVPAVLEAHQYLLEKALKNESARVAAVNDALAAGDAAFGAGRLEDALASYNRALEALPVSPARRAAFTTQWGQAFFETETAARLTAADDAAKRDLATAQALIKSEQPEQALTAFVAILSKYPVGQVGFASLTGIRQAASQLQGSGSKEAELTASLNRTNAELAQAKTQLAQAQQAALNATAGQAAAVAELSALKIAKTVQTAVDAGADPVLLKAAQDEVARLQPQAAALQTMKSGFAGFVAQDTPLWKTASPAAADVLQSKLLLNSFLSSPDMAAAFPGLADKVGRYEKGFLEAGQKEGLINVNDAVDNLGKLETLAERRQYIASLQRRYANNEAMTSVLKALAALF